MKQRKERRRLTPHAHRRVIGLLGLALPSLVVVLSVIFPVRSGWTMLDSISAFYYTSATALFVGVLFALAIFLFVYGGYKGDVADKRLGRVSGVAALGVAFFPTAAPAGFNAPLWWTDWMQPAHYVSASVLFGTFILFSMWLFRLTAAESEEEMSAGKRARNKVYWWCGVIMIASVLWAASSFWTGQPIFIPEAIALIAFSISWLTKGRTIRWLVALRQGGTNEVEAA